MSVSVDYERDGWTDDVDWEDIVARAVKAAVAASQYAPMLSASYQASVSVKLAQNEEVRELNNRFRQKDRPTNVLSFPMVQEDLLEAMTNSDDGEVLLGDIIVAEGVAAREAAEKQVELSDHATHLVVHGTLHLLGYDHEQNEAAAEAMEELEAKALASLGIADPY